MSLAGFLPSCASILKGGLTPLTVNSNVHGAKVSFGGVVVGRTPFSGMVQKSGAHKRITVSKEGYETRTVLAQTGVEPTFWVNILSGGVFGSTTDYASDAMYVYSPATYNIDLVKSAPEGNEQN